MKFQNEMKDKIQCLYEQYCITNEKESEKKCRAVLNKVAKELEEKLKKGEYIKPGGYKMFCSDRENAEMAYLGAPGKGVKTEDILLEFKHQKAVEANNILTMDNSLTAQKKEIEDVKQRMAEIQMQNKVMAEQMAVTQEMLKMMENHGKKYQFFDKNNGRK
ncbi:guanylate-binding protein 1-like [Protopterus annectens]|uniref:guanylate-binding protein 1-like n=1 Tax=Protopterus annectens TaxID=7888 RepID=UPI001CFA062C|nr:guanylate-binding protein 1-like [Protopterus annectens]